MKGSLFLVPSSISDTQEKSKATTSPEVIDILEHCNYFVMETPKAGRAYIKSVVPNFDFQSKEYFQLNKYSSDKELDDIIEL